MASSLTGWAAADELYDPIPSSTEAVDLDSGWLTASGPGPSLVYATVVSIPDAEWVRLDLAGTVLGGRLADGSAAYLRISSLLDGAEQMLDVDSFRQWNRTSAYFNGDKVLVQLYGSPEARSRVRIPAAIVSAPSEGGVATLCGPDNRVATDDPRECRLMPVGCTAWLFDDHPYSLLTAGHCMSGTTINLVEFNVPPSLSNGTIQHPPPSDQYSIDQTSKQSFYSGLGNDWGFFGVFKNSTTFLSPLVAQGDSMITALPPPATGTARITGFGVDSGTANQTNQTSSGSFTSFSGTLLKYAVDTEGGNSGSPVIRESDGKAIGIHTNGGCNSGGGSNSGTGLNNTGLQNALANPKGVCLTNPPSCGLSNAGTCFAVHATPTCNDADCCVTVCAIDPFCCQATWDGQCAGEAAAECAASPCGGGCQGDLNGDNAVNGADLAGLLAAWGGTGCGDLDTSGSVDGADLAVLLSKWGDCP